MSEVPPSSETKTGPDTQARDALLFASLVSQQAQMAWMFLGRGPAPGDAEPAVDLEMARTCIDTLEMLETKTRGHRTPAESEFLQRELMNLRMCFVETVDAGAATPKRPPTPSSPAAHAERTVEQPASAEAETTKRFVKKYGAGDGGGAPTAAS